MSSPKPKGIPNSVGNGCWFASMSQALFRQNNIRNEIYQFESQKIQFPKQKQYEKALNLLQKYFRDIEGPNTSFSNKDLLYSLPYQNGWLYREENATGKESTMALTSLLQVFSALCGNEKAGVHSFATPLSDCLLITTATNHNFVYLPEMIISNQETIVKAVLNELPKLNFLPNLLFVEADSFHKPYLKPDLFFKLPEPMEYIAMDCDLKKCDSEVTYELISMIIYHGSDASHATALIKSDNKKEWYHYNDSYVSKEIDPISLLSPTFWPKVFLYQKI